MEPEDRINPTKMAMVKKYGLIGYTIKQIGITYNKNGSVCNLPLPHLFTEQIIEYIKYAEAQGLKKIVITIPNPSDYFAKNKTRKNSSSNHALFMQTFYVPKPWYFAYSKEQDNFNANRYYTNVAINPCKPEIAAATRIDIVLWDLANPCRPIPTILPFDTAQESKLAFDSFAYNPTGSQIAISRYGTVKICDIETKAIISTKVPVRYAWIHHYSLLFSHDGNKLIVYINNEATDRFNIYNLATKTWSYKIFSNMMIEKIARYDDDCYISYSPTTGAIKLWNSNLEQLDNNYPLPLKTYNLFRSCDTDVYREKESQVIPAIMSDEVRNRIHATIYLGENTRRPFLSADQTKLAKVVNEHDVPSHIIYTDTTPDVNQLTIDQLRIMQQQASNPS